MRSLAILGGGPLGIEAAAAAASVGFDVRVFERGDVGAGVSMWGHVRMFTPWRLDRSSLGARLLREAGRPEPDPEVCPTGHELVAQYLAPLAGHPLLRGRVETGARVLAVSREGTLKGDLLGKSERRQRPFRLVVEKNGLEEVFHADVLFDCSGTYGTPRWLGSGGIAAPGERQATIARHIPDFTGGDRGTYADQRVLLVGGGLSAATAICDLAKLSESAPRTQVVWATRGDRRPPLTPVVDDSLPGRVALHAAANALASGASRPIQLRPGVSVERLDGERVWLRGAEGVREERFDRVVALVGYRPDRTLWEELQVHECYASGGPMKLAAALLAAGGGGDCLAQKSQGPAALASPEPDFVVLGAKSYGRGNNFLLRLGHDQVRDALRLVTGDEGLELS